MSLAVILDMDGLLLDTEPMSLRAWQDAACSLGYELGADVFDRMIGRTAAANAGQLIAEFGAGFPARELAASAGARYRALLEVHGVPHKPGLVDFLRFLDRRRMPRAVATSTATALAREKLGRAGVLEYLGIVVGGDRVGRGKPAPDIFLEAARTLGQAPADCVVFEDSEPGILGAAAAGMRPVLIPDRREPRSSTRDAAYAVVDSLPAACRLLEEMLRE